MFDRRAKPGVQQLLERLDETDAGALALVVEHLQYIPLGELPHVHATPPQPWSDEDWERDKRRATAAGIVVGAIGPDGQDTQLKDLWKANAEHGVDIVGEMAAQQRADAIADHQARVDGFLDQARAQEDDRRSSAINDELVRRARNRVAAPDRSATRRLPGGL